MSACHQHPASISRREVMRMGLGGLSALSLSELISQRGQATPSGNKDTEIGRAHV
jgi:hypothetical protein